MMTKLFISYSSRDAELAARLEASIEALGSSVYNPLREMTPGSDFRKSIQAAIRRSDALIAIVSSPDSAANSWISYELGMAEAAGKDVLIVATQDYGVKDLPSDLAGWKIVHFDPDRTDLAARQIVDQLSSAARA